MFQLILFWGIFWSNLAKIYNSASVFALVAPPQLIVGQVLSKKVVIENSQILYEKAKILFHMALFVTSFEQSYQV